MPTAQTYTVPLSPGPQASASFWLVTVCIGLDGLPQSCNQGFSSCVWRALPQSGPLILFFTSYSFPGKDVWVHFLWNSMLQGFPCGILMPKTPSGSWYVVAIHTGHNWGSVRTTTGPCSICWIHHLVPEQEKEKEKSSSWLQVWMRVFAKLQKFRQLCTSVLSGLDFLCFHQRETLGVVMTVNRRALLNVTTEGLHGCCPFWMRTRHFLEGQHSFEAVDKTDCFFLLLYIEGKRGNKQEANRKPQGTGQVDSVMMCCGRL